MKNTGFSLVELLVVIAIMAVLAGVAVPVYSHYTTQAKERVDEGVFAEVWHAAEIEAARDGHVVTEVEIVTEVSAEKTVVKSYVVHTKAAGSSDAAVTTQVTNEEMIKVVPVGDALQAAKYIAMTRGVQSTDGVNWVVKS